MLALVRNPDEVRASTTRRQGLFGFTLDHVRDAVHRLRENVRPEPAPSSAQISDSDEPKPFNPGPGSGPAKPEGAVDGAVMELPANGADSPTAMRRLRDGSKRVYQWAKTPTNPEQEVETASSDIPGMLVLVLLAMVILSAVIAWTWRRLNVSR